MTDIWSGDILLPDGNVIQDVGFASPDGASGPVWGCAALRFLTTVETAKIPLYLAAGSSLDVWTTCEATEAWFESMLLSKPASTGLASNAGTEWWALARSQSPIGILVQVENIAEEAQKPRITEILLYGTIAPPTAGALPTPPSSSPEHGDAQADQLPELRVHALPLSSTLLYQPPTTSLLPPSPALGTSGASTNVDARFLSSPINAHTTTTTTTTRGSPKRKRDIFQEATIATKKARGKDGVGIAAAAAAARGTESQPPLGHRKSLSIDTKAVPFPDGRPQSGNSGLSRPASRQLSRSPSISSDTRPLSRKSLLDGQNKRSTLSQVATMPLQPEEPTTESRNKEALSRVVMAAMRMHGLQQRKKTHARRASVAQGFDESQNMSEEAEADADEAAKDEEFKLMYHQTYKGAAFALRKHISEKSLHAQPDRLRDVVEKLLSVFLSDPLAQPLPANTPTEPVATPGTKLRLGLPDSTHSYHASPFDLPSAARPGMIRSKTDSHIYTGSPVSKRRDKNGDTAPV